MDLATGVASAQEEQLSVCLGWMSMGLEDFVPVPAAAAQQPRCLTQASWQGRQGRQTLAGFVRQVRGQGGLEMWVEPAERGQGPLCGWPS